MCVLFRGLRRRRCRLRPPEIPKEVPAAVSVLLPFFGLALVDSINPSALLVTLYLLRRPMPVRTVAAYMSGVFASYLTIGILLVLGLDALLDRFGDALWRSGWPRWSPTAWSSSRRPSPCWGFISCWAGGSKDAWSLSGRSWSGRARKRCCGSSASWAFTWCWTPSSISTSSAWPR